MIRIALLMSAIATSAAAATELPDVGPELAPCLERHVTGAPYVAGLMAQGWTVVSEADKPQAQLDLSEALLAALGDEHAHTPGPDNDDQAHGTWFDRWTHREETLLWILSASQSRPLYQRGDAVLLLMGEQREDETSGLLHRTTCLVGAPELGFVGRVLAEAAVLPEGGFRTLSFEPANEDAMPYTAIDVMRQLPDPVENGPTHLDGLITTQVFPVPTEGADQ